MPNDDREEPEVRDVRDVRDEREEREVRADREEREEREVRDVRDEREEREIPVPRTTFATANAILPIGRKKPVQMPINNVTVSDSAKLLPGAATSIPGDINKGLSSAKVSTMLSVFGMPRDSVGKKCRPVTRAPLKNLIITDDVGPFSVTGVRQAVQSLKRVMKQLKKHDLQVYDSLDTAGMLCVRFIGGTTKLSNHSWGCAVDISINGRLDGLDKSERKDGKTLAGLVAMAPFFNDEGWYWGVGFSNFEDGMHFELADETIREWHKEGKFGKAVQKRTVTDTNLSIGDKGIEVVALQRALAAEKFDIIADGDFGSTTHGIVMDFQAENGLKPDGIVGPDTKKALGLT